MTRDHSLIEELMAVDALGGLDDDDDRERLERERVEHGVDCPECAAIEEGFAETAGRLAFALTPEPVDEAVLDRILAAPRPGEGELTVVEATVPPTDEVSARRARRSPVWRALVAAAAVVAIVVVAVTTLAPSPTSVQASSSQQLVTFTGETEGTLAMAFTPGEPGAVLWGSGLPDPGSDRVLEIWMIEGGEAISGGCVVPADGVVAFRVEADVGAADAMAVTEEPSDCPSAPTTEPFLLADLTTVV
jgi:hypothetical protein